MNKQNTQHTKTKLGMSLLTSATPFAGSHAVVCATMAPAGGVACAEWRFLE